MKLFALGDPHLSFGLPKPMDIFGPAWRDHAARLADAWRASVAPDDIVLVAGDVSWAMRLEAARIDLDWLSALPGRKVLVRGNHDYWWASPKKLRDAAPGIDFIHNDAARIGPAAVAGARLWDFPECAWPHPPAPDGASGRPATIAASAARPGGEAANPEKIRARELERLRLSLARLPSDPDGIRICLTHFPVTDAAGSSTPLTRLIASHGVSWCVFGHIHGWPGALPPGADAMVDGMRCVLASLDAVGFAPKLLCRLR